MHLHAVIDPLEFAEVDGLDLCLIIKGDSANALERFESYVVLVFSHKLKNGKSLRKMELQEDQLPSNRKFGIFASSVLLAVGGYFYWKDEVYLSVVLGIFGALFVLITVANDRLLLPLNKLWMRFGLLLGAIVSPIVLGVLFYFMITPIAIVMRVFGRDELRINKRNTCSEWRIRDPDEVGSESFKRQF